MSFSSQLHTTHTISMVTLRSGSAACFWKSISSLCYEADSSSVVWKMRCSPWTCWLRHVARLSITPGRLCLTDLRQRGGVWFWTFLFCGACVPYLIPCVLWWEAGPHQTVTKSKPTYLTLMFPCKSFSLSRKKQKSPLDHILNGWGSNMSRLSRVDLLPCHAVSSSLLSCFCGFSSLQCSRAAFRSVSLNLWRLGRQIPRSSLLICRSVIRLIDGLSWLWGLWFVDFIIYDLAALRTAS